MGTLARVFLIGGRGGVVGGEEGLYMYIMLLIFEYFLNKLLYK